MFVQAEVADEIMNSHPIPFMNIILTRRSDA